MPDPAPDLKAHEAARGLSAVAAARTLAEETSARHGALCWPGTAHIEEVIREAEERGAAREREECAKLAQDAWCLMSTFSIEQSAQYAAACAEVAKIIRARAAADSLLESEG